MSDMTVSSLTSLSREYEAITHNLANANTAGYKRRVSVLTQATAASATPGAGLVRQVREQDFTDFTQGRLVQTGRTFDVALDGPGFFVVEGEQGQRYTRNGVFRTNAQGQLVDGDQRRVLGDGGPITIPGTVSALQVEIAPDGRVLAAGQVVGKLRIADFQDPTQLRPVGLNVFEAGRGAQPAAADKTTVVQGFQEGSNVSAVEELVSLIKVSRLYEANVRIMQARSERGKSLMQVAMA